jgi:glucose/arabinose dehydrogenase/mono/diheme cytochrome c family protein
MQQVKLFIFICLSGALYFLNSCNSGTSAGDNVFSSDSAVIVRGKSLFEKNCSACHSLRQDGIGPALGGITDEVSVVWLHQFIKNPQEMFLSGDKRAAELRKTFKSAMPSFTAFKDDDVNAILAFLHVNKTDSFLANDDNKSIKDPIPEKIKLSPLVINLEPVTQFPATNNNGNTPLTRITKLSFQPGTGTLFVNDLKGQLYKLENKKPILYMDLPKLKPAFIDAPGLATGFGSFAFHPRFEETGVFYTTHTEAPGSGKANFSYDDSIKITVQWVLTEWKAKNPLANTFSGTGRELLRINMVTGAHGVQEITFNPLSKSGDKDYGLLYIGVGDGASVQEGYSFIPHSKESVWGAILRIDPAGNNSINGKYGIPPDNPFVHDADTKTIKEIYAYGFRNPHRITWSKKGEMLAGNIGQANSEALYLIKPGHDYGWPLREGNFLFKPDGNLNSVYQLPANDSINKFTYPIAEYDHDEGLAISGGYEYWGKTIAPLKGKFMFGDIPSGRLFYINMNDIQQGKQAVIQEWGITINKIPKTLKQACGSDRVDLRFGRDAQGELYVLTKADGRLYKMTSATE